MILGRRKICTERPSKWVKAAFIALGICVLLLTGCSRGEEGKEIQQEKRVEPVSTHPSFVTTQELNAVLASSLGEASSQGSVLAGELSSTAPRIISAVVPHHLVAGPLLTDVMKILARQQPRLIILVGPNHLNKGGKSITGYHGWETPEGVVEAEDKTVSLLLEKGLAVRDEEVLSKEHSIGALVPLLRHFLPGTKIVPLVFHHDVNLQEIDLLLTGLEPFLTEKTLLLSSVDFSHYLTRSEAQDKDRETLGYMRKYDYTTLFHLGNDYLDSPASLIMAFRLAERQGIKEFTLLNNTNSGIILQNDFIETTSYFTLVFPDKS